MTSALTDAPPKAVDFADLWSIQESLLQAYRTIFMTVEAVLFSVAAIVLATDKPWLVFPLAALGGYLVYVWFQVCRARARAVTFIHWMMQRYESGDPIEQPYARFREFQRARTYNSMDVLADERFKYLANSRTRRRMDVELPIAFGVMWLLLLGTALFAGAAA